MNESDEEADEEEFTESKDLFDENDKFWFNSLKYKKIVNEHHLKDYWKLIKQEKKAYVSF